MSWGMIVAGIIGVAATAGSTYYQKTEADKAQDELEKANKEAEEEAARLLAMSRPEGVAATVDVGSRTGEVGSYQDFLIPTETKKSTTAGLGSGTTTTGGLGFS